MGVEFKLLGTGAGLGIPSFYCDCVACREAYADPHRARARSGAVLDTGVERVLIDASPDLRTQLTREKIPSIDHLLITHWHYDHFGGIGDLEYYVRLARRRPVKLYLPPSAVHAFHSAFPFLVDVFQVETWAFGRSLVFQGAKLTVLPANHNIETGGVLVEGERRLAYFTDTAGLPESTVQEIEGVDFLICDATFHGENWFPDAHMNFEQAISLGQQVKAKKTVLTHLALHYSVPVTAAQVEEMLKDHPAVALAHDGMVFALSG